jgi:hypothetical protein
MTYTRLAGRCATRDEAAQAVRWAARDSIKVPLELRRHECGKPGHQAEPWLLVSVVRIGEEPAPEVAVVGVNGHEGEGER